MKKLLLEIICIYNNFDYYSLYNIWFKWVPEYFQFWHSLSYLPLVWKVKDRVIFSFLCNTPISKYRCIHLILKPLLKKIFTVIQFFFRLPYSKKELSSVEFQSKTFLASFLSVSKCITKILNKGQEIECSILILILGYML